MCIRDSIAAASIAQVHFAKIKNENQEKQVAIKILRPDIEQLFNEELDALMLFAYIVENSISKAIQKTIDNIYPKENYKDLDKLTVISFFPEVIKAIKRKESQIKCNLLIAFDYKEMHTQDILNLAMTTKADGIGAQNHERLDEKFIQAVRDIEKTIHVWTVNSNEEAESYYRNGIDSITTNKPLSIRNYLEALE